MPWGAESKTFRFYKYRFSGIINSRVRSLIAISGHLLHSISRLSGKNKQNQNAGELIMKKYEYCDRETYLLVLSFGVECVFGPGLRGLTLGEALSQLFVLRPQFVHVWQQSAQLPF